MQNNDMLTQGISGLQGQQMKKPRKPNVFIDDEKYAMAKMLVAQNASTMEIARALNVSQMTAWKVRDAIVKGVPLSYRSKRDMRVSGLAIMKHNETIANTESNQMEITEQQQQQQLQQQQLQMQQMQLQQQQILQRQLQQQQANAAGSSGRRRLKAAERELRDKEITREILELIKEDSNIQYWKVSARLAEKGYPISPSSVCQKLKSMGIHRRWKPGDKPPLLDMEHIKSTATTSLANSSVANSSADESVGGGPSTSYEQQYDIAGAHFLSSFSR